MTFQRVLARNGLRDGDYTRLPESWPAHGSGAHANLDAPLCGYPSAETLAAAYRSLWRDRIGEGARLEHRARQLAGDLRRLERDVVDEGSICSHIVRRTGLAPDVVAGVLREFAEL